MGFFKSKQERDLDIIISRIDMNMSNNYKDAAQMNLREFEDKLTELKESGKAKQKVLDAYESRLGIYKEKCKGYTHKDQKPFWT